MRWVYCAKLLANDYLFGCRCAEKSWGCQQKTMHKRKKINKKHTFVILKYKTTGSGK